MTQASGILLACMFDTHSEIGFWVSYLCSSCRSIYVLHKPGPHAGRALHCGCMPCCVLALLLLLLACFHARHRRRRLHRVCDGRCDGAWHQESRGLGRRQGSGTGAAQERGSHLHQQGKQGCDADTALLRSADRCAALLYHAAGMPKMQQALAGQQPTARCYGHTSALLSYSPPATRYASQQLLHVRQQHHARGIFSLYLCTSATCCVCPFQYRRAFALTAWRRG